jgi:AcrR family transcriptional regulator
VPSHGETADRPFRTLLSAQFLSPPRTGIDTFLTDRSVSPGQTVPMTDTTEALLCATSRALSTHGYANLTMQDIADEADLSTAALHYHYDSKGHLLAAFQEYIGERFLARVRDADTAEAADERLSQVLDAALSPPESDDVADLQTALLEPKAQAPYEAPFPERSRAVDAEFRSYLADIVAAGVDQGVYRDDLDPERAARFVATVLAGSQTRHVSVGQSPETTRALLATYVETTLRADREAP